MWSMWDLNPGNLRPGGLGFHLVQASSSHAHHVVLSWSSRRARAARGGVLSSFSYLRSPGSIYGRCSINAHHIKLDKISVSQGNLSVVGGTRVYDGELERWYISGLSPEPGIQSELNIGGLNRNVHIHLIQSKRMNHIAGGTFEKCRHVRYIAWETVIVRTCSQFLQGGCVGLGC